MIPLIQRKHASLRSCCPRADICLLTEGDGLTAFLGDAEKVHALLPQLTLRNFGNPDDLEYVFTCTIPYTVALKAIGTLTTAHSVALCEWVTDHGYVAFSFHNRQPGAVPPESAPSQPPAVQEPEVEEDFV